MSQAIQDIVVAPEGDTSEPVDVDGRETAIQICTYLFLFLFFYVPSVFLGLFSSMLKQFILPSALGSLLSNVGTMLVARCFWAFNYIDYFMFYLFYCA